MPMLPKLLPSHSSPASIKLLPHGAFAVQFDVSNSQLVVVHFNAPPLLKLPKLPQLDIMPNTVPSHFSPLLGSITLSPHFESEGLAPAHPLTSNLQFEPHFKVPPVNNGEY